MHDGYLPYNCANRTYTNTTTGHVKEAVGMYSDHMLEVEMHKKPDTIRDSAD